LGKCPKAKLFRGYIDLEIQLREFNRCRTLYDKFLQFDSENCSAWMKFAELENLLGDTDRARSVFELAVNQPRLDMPELLWKQYIDFEVEQEEYDKARLLYKNLLSKTNHVKVWLSLAQFEIQTEEESQGSNISRARKVYEDANQRLREDAIKANDEAQGKEFRVMLLENWRDFELENQDEESIKKVSNLMPKRVKKRRRIEQDEDAPGGADAGGWEEYFDYIFPEDEGAKPNLKLLAMAKMWKKKKEVEPEPEPETETSTPEKEMKEESDTEEERIPISEEIPTVSNDDTDQNLDADDEDIKNESSDSESESSDESDDEKDEPKSKQRKKE